MVKENKQGLDMVYEGTIITDRDGNIIFANDEVAKIMSLDLGNLIGRSCKEWFYTYLDGRVLPDDLIPFMRVMNSGEPVYDMQLAMGASENYMVRLSINVSPLYSEAGQVVGTVASFGHLKTKTDRANLLAQIEQKEQIIEELTEDTRFVNSTLNVLIETIPVGVMVADTTGVITMANPAAHLLLGGEVTGTAYGPEGKYTLHHLDGTPLRDRELPLPRALKKGELIKDMEMLVRDAKGAERTILAAGSPIRDPNGKITGAVAVLQEISRFKQTEEELRLRQDLLEELVDARTRELKAANEKLLNHLNERTKLEREVAHLDRLSIIGEMAASIGHEVRNPMTTIRGFLQVLAGKPDCKQYADYYSLMIDELDRANSIITEFLSLARHRTMNLKEQNLNEIIEALYPLIQADAFLSDKIVKVEPGEIPNRLVDEKEIRQLILNLTRNGLEAMEPGGALTVRTYSENSEVVLAVQDEGPGIEPAFLAKLGTPFLTTKEKGTGLGLVVCYGIAKRHNATIDVKTGEKGTTFLVRFKALD